MTTVTEIMEVAAAANDSRTLCKLINQLTKKSRPGSSRRWTRRGAAGPDQQAGFRSGRLVRDPLLIFHIPSQKPLEGGKTGVATWIDFKAVFDTMRHSTLMTAMAAAGCSRETMALVEEIYKKASAVARDSDVLINITRGCLQGCVLSPLLFCLVLALVLKDVKMDPVVVDGPQR